MSFAITEARGPEVPRALSLLVDVGFVRALEDGVTAAEALLQALAEDGTLVGAIHGRTGERASESTVWHLGVLPEFRRHGVGRALLDAYCDHERAAGAGRVDVRVAPGPSRALRSFYEACGWRWNGTGYYRDLER